MTAARQRDAQLLGEAPVCAVVRSRDDADGKSRPRDAASPGARATARWRERRARGSIVAAVEVFGHEVEVLVQLGLLQREQAHDRGWIGYAVERLVERVQRRRMGPAR